MAGWVGRTLGKVSIELLLARSQVADFYLARHTGLQRAVAVQFLDIRESDDPKRLANLQRHIRLVSTLIHPNILPVHEFGIVDQRPYIVTDYVPGVSLAAYMTAMHAAHASIRLDALGILAEALSGGLQYALWQSLELARPGYTPRQLAEEGDHVVIFNRDIKPGGLAEYGIYPEKYKMKDGLRKQFRQILQNPNIEYYGNVTVAENADLTLTEIKDMGFQAVLVTAGAQGTKCLGLPVEDIPKGVYHAKDVVYHYNKLPASSQKELHIGRRVALVGAGNVMMDIARYLIRTMKVGEVLAVVRRGPAEVKFDKKEMEYVIANLDQAALDAEIARVSPVMQAIGQDVEASRAFILSALPKAIEPVSDTRFLFDFLASPTRLLGDESGYGVTGIRFGWFATKDKQVYANCFGYYYDSVLCHNIMPERIGERLLEPSRFRRLLKEGKDVGRENLKTTLELVETNDQWSFVFPGGAYSCFLKYDFNVPSWNFCEEMLKVKPKGVYLVPGISYNEYCEHHFRLGFGASSDLFKAGPRVVEEAAKKYRK